MDYSVRVSFVIMILATGIFLFSFIQERRRIINGFLFLIAYLSIAIFFLLSAAHYQQVLIYFIGIAAIIAPALLLAPFIFSLTFIFIVSGVKLVIREGIRFTNLLSLLTGLLIVGFFLVLTLQSQSSIFVFLIALILPYAIYYFGFFIIFLLDAILYTVFLPKKNIDFLIVLGSGLIGDKITPLLASRVDKAIAFFRKQQQKGKTPMLIMSGGQGSDELTTEAYAMKAYAVAQGIPEAYIIMEDKATNTYENMLFSKNIIESMSAKPYRALFFTNRYHIFRSSLFAKQVGLNAHGVGAKTKMYFGINAFVREFIGVLSLHKKLHIIIPTCMSLLLVMITTIKLLP